MPSSFRTGLVFDEHFLTHDTGTENRVVMRDSVFDLSPEPHPSSVTIIKRIKEFLDGSGLTAMMKPIEARPATEDELTMFHTKAYIQAVRDYAINGGPNHGSWGEIDEETVMSPGSFEAALYAAGGAMNAVDAVMNGSVRNVYALLRPPCHHATSNQAMGFCIFNNTALAAFHARKTYGLERIMIIDWDVHHGNGTQDAFYADKNVLFVSLHQENWFPKLSGELEQVGIDEGAGFTVNVPLPPGTGDKGYHAAFEQLVVPIGKQFQPQLIIVTAGQDASWLDPLAQMMMTMNGFHTISQIVVDLAEEVCDGRLVLLQAGGYSAPYVPYCTVGAVEPLLGVDLGIVDLYDATSEQERSQSILSQETLNAITRAKQWHKKWWNV